jgi:hypothetical protein
VISESKEFDLATDEDFIYTNKLLKLLEEEA